MTYPAEPWHLRGQLYLSVWSVPAGRLPALAPELAGAVRPLTVAGRCLVGAAWVRYEPGGVLEYQELLCAVLVRSGARVRVSITSIWVDSVPSRDGGRALWGIPKDLATLRVDGADGAGVEASATGSGPIAQAHVVSRIRLPGWWPVRFSVTQGLDGAPKTSPVRARGRLRLGRARWRVDPDGPLGYLAGARPLVSAALCDFDMHFGTDPAR